MSEFDAWPERWTDIPEFTMYEISTMKRIRNKQTGGIVKPRNNGKGCFMVKMYHDKLPYYRSLDKLYTQALTVFLNESD
jgi:hypothetical protein